MNPSPVEGVNHGTAVAQPTAVAEAANNVAAAAEEDADAVGQGLVFPANNVAPPANNAGGFDYSGANGSFSFSGTPAPVEGVNPFAHLTAAPAVTAAGAFHGILPAVLAADTNTTEAREATVVHEGVEEQEEDADAAAPANNVAEAAAVAQPTAAAAPAAAADTRPFWKRGVAPKQAPSNSFFRKP